MPLAPYPGGRLFCAVLHICTGMYKNSYYTANMHKKIIKNAKICKKMVDKSIFMQYIIAITNDFKFLGGYIL